MTFLPALTSGRLPATPWRSVKDSSDIQCDGRETLPCGGRGITNLSRRLLSKRVVAA